MCLSKIRAKLSERLQQVDRAVEELQQKKKNVEL